MIACRKYNLEDYSFLRKMLFEAVFWSRTDENRPSLEEGLSYDYTKHVLVDFGNREGDVAVIAEVKGKKAGAAFIRYWNEKENTRGYISEDIPVLVIGVAKEYRRRGVAGELMDALKALAMEEHIQKISLCVTKTNFAYHLYAKQKFKIVEELEDSYNMLWIGKTEQ